MSRQYTDEQREANREYSRAYRAALPEKTKAALKASYQRRKVQDPAALLLKGAKERAKNQGVPCTISKEHIVIPTTCPILGIPITINVLGNNGGNRDQSPSLDKVKPELGYIPGNVRVVSNKANRLKADNTIETLEAILKYMKG